MAALHVPDPEVGVDAQEELEDDSQENFGPHLSKPCGQNDDRKVLSKISSAVTGVVKKGAGAVKKGGAGAVKKGAGAVKEGAAAVKKGIH